MSSYTWSCANSGRGGARRRVGGEGGRRAETPRRARRPVEGLVGPFRVLLREDRLRLQREDGRRELRHRVHPLREGANHALHVSRKLGARVQLRRHRVGLLLGGHLARQQEPQHALRYRLLRPQAAPRQPHGRGECSAAALRASLVTLPTPEWVGSFSCSSGMVNPRKRMPSIASSCDVSHSMHLIERAPPISWSIVTLSTIWAGERGLRATREGAKGHGCGAFRMGRGRLPWRHVPS